MSKLHNICSGFSIYLQLSLVCSRNTLFYWLACVVWMLLIWALNMNLRSIECKCELFKMAILCENVLSLHRGNMMLWQWAISLWTTVEKSPYTFLTVFFLTECWVESVLIWQQDQQEEEVREERLMGRYHLTQRFPICVWHLCGCVCSACHGLKNSHSYEHANFMWLMVWRCP